MRFDHIVVHIDNDKNKLHKLQQMIAPLGIPFEPSAGKGTSGFKASNIWIGRQYFEIIRLLKPTGGGWVKHWVNRYNKGIRGTYCLFLVCDDIDKTSKTLRANGLHDASPERVTFKALFGLLKKTLPWRIIYTPVIPGTNIEIGFIQYDPDPNDYIKQFLVPNSDQNGIEGINSVSLSLELTQEAKNFLNMVLPAIEEKTTGLHIPLDDGGSFSFLNSHKTGVRLICKNADGRSRGWQFEFEDIEVEI